MISHYTVPNSVLQEFESFKKSHADFLSGKLDPLTFKTLRVPFGVYEQREPDTYMVRIKLAGGVITPNQLLALANLAEKYANPNLHVTTRGGVQLHYVKAQDMLSVIEGVHKAGLTSRGGGGNTVRNITGDPYAGIAPDEAFDTTPHVLALTSKMLDQKDSYALPRKFKISFSGSSADRGGATFIDVGFIAKLQSGERGFRVFVAGGMGAKSRLGTPLFDFVPEGEIFLISQAIKKLFDKEGNRRNKHAARLRFLIEELGFDLFRQRVIEEMESLRNEGNWQIALEESFNPEPIAYPSNVAISEEKKLWWNRFVSPQKQAGYYTIKVPLTLGDIHFEHARALALMLQKAPLADHLLRFGADQNLYLRNLQKSEALLLHPLLTTLSPQSNNAPLIGNMVACTGAATCQLGITRPRGAVAAIEKALIREGLFLEELKDFKIHLSGCPNSCGRHAIADLGFFGKVNREGGHPYPAYNVLVGAMIGEDQTRFGKKIAEVSAFGLPAFVVELLRLWSGKQSSYKNFAEWIDGEGEAIVVDLAAKYAKIASFEEDKNPYFDFSSQELFSLKGRGSGECSAGMYDLIEADKKALKEALLQEMTEENLTRIRLLSARMLLVAKGEEARDELSVLKAFKRLFVDSGLIEDRFASLLEGSATPESIELAQAVLSLYDTMDHTLKFAAEKQKITNPTAESADMEVKVAEEEAGMRFKDYRGVACPMNFVKTKMDLAQMQSGELLEILLDDGAPIENVPRSVSAEGHKIVSQAQEGSIWRVRIQKQ